MTANETLLLSNGDAYREGRGWFRWSPSLSPAPVSARLSSALETSGAAKAGAGGHSPEAVGRRKAEVVASDASGGGNNFSVLSCAPATLAWATSLTGEILPGAPFAAGKPTSHAAAVAIEPTRHKQAGRVLAFLRQRGAHGATSDEIEVALGLSHQSASGRKRDLEKLGLLRETTATRPTRSGREATVLVAANGGGDTAQLF